MAKTKKRVPKENDERVVVDPNEIRNSDPGVIAQNPSEAITDETDENTNKTPEDNQE